MLQDLTERLGRFMGSSEDYKNCSLVIIGAPMDFTVSFRPGTRNGPAEIRNVSEGLEEFSFDLGLDLSNRHFFDAGDILLPLGSVEKSLECIKNAVNIILKDGKKPLVLGGEHLVSLPVVEQVARVYPEVIVLHFDAHADLRDEYLGEKLSHATVMRRIAEVVGGERIFQLGIRSGTREEFQWGSENTRMYPGKILEPLRDIINEIKKVPVYITLDIDVVDPAFAPGTGTPEPGGCNSSEILRALHLLKGLNVVGMDLVEVCPVLDKSQITALLAAKLVRDAILLFG